MSAFPVLGGGSGGSMSDVIDRSANTLINLLAKFSTAAGEAVRFRNQVRIISGRSIVTAQPIKIGRPGENVSTPNTATADFKRDTGLSDGQPLREKEPQSVNVLTGRNNTARAIGAIVLIALALFALWLLRR